MQLRLGPKCRSPYGRCPCGGVRSANMGMPFTSKGLGSQVIPAPPGIALRSMTGVMRVFQREIARRVFDGRRLEARDRPGARRSFSDDRAVITRGRLQDVCGVDRRCDRAVVPEGSDRGVESSVCERVFDTVW